MALVAAEVAILAYAHLEGQPHALSGIVPAFRVPPALHLANGQDAHGLDVGQGVLIAVMGREPQGFLEEAVAEGLQLIRRGGATGYQAA